MQSLNAIAFHGILGTTALVVSNDAPTEVKVAARLAKVVFGNRIQICDGTNDHVQIQAAIDAVCAANVGGKVVLLEGTFNISAAIVPPDVTEGHIIIEGQGMPGGNEPTSATTIHAIGNIHAFDGAGKDVWYPVFRNFGIDHDDPASTGYGFNFAKTLSEAVFDHISVRYFTRGFYSADQWVVNMSNMLIDYCTIGFYFIDGTSTTMTSCYANHCTTGYRIKSLIYSNFISCACDNSTTGYWLGAEAVGDATESLFGVNLIGCGVESCSGNAILLRRVMGPVSISGCFVSTDDDTIFLDGGERIHFHDLFLSAGAGKKRIAISDAGGNFTPRLLIMVNIGTDRRNLSGIPDETVFIGDNQSVGLPVFTVAGVPSAAHNAYGIIYCSDGAAGNPCVAFSDGVNWKRCDTLANVSV